MCTIGLCVPRVRPRKSMLLKVGTLGHTIKFSKGTWHHVKNRERKGPSQGVMQKCEPQERNPCAPKFAERTQEETLQQERCARREAWNRRQINMLKNKDKNYVLLAYRSMGNAGTLRKSQKSENSWSIPERRCTC